MVWFGRFFQVHQQRIANAGALSRAISRSNDPFNEAMAKSWRRRQQTGDRASPEFSDYMRGTKYYQTPILSLILKKKFFKCLN